jgi:competence protein ComEC
MKKQFYSWFVILFLLLMSIASTPINKVEANWFKSSSLEVHFLDVGQGDSVLVLFPGGKTMLVDGGPRINGPSVVKYLKQNNINEIDLLVSTHPDADHLGGLLDVLNQLKVKKVLDSGKIHPTETYREYLQVLRGLSIPVKIAKEGQAIHLDEKVDVHILNSNNGENENNEASIVMKLSIGSIDYLLAADAEAGAEREMVWAYELDAEIIKVGHHGSVTSTTDTLLGEVKPEVAILSHGLENPYGHPHKDVVERLKQQKTTMYSTAQSGSIIVKSNGRKYEVYTKRFVSGKVKLIHPNPYVGNLAITELDLKEEKVTIKNNRNHDVTMMGWKITSEVGNQIFHFPSDFVLKAGESVTVYSAGKPKVTEQQQLRWKEKTNIWNNIGDRAMLYTPNGGLVDYEKK